MKVTAAGRLFGKVMAAAVIGLYDSFAGQQDRVTFTQTKAKQTRHLRTDMTVTAIPMMTYHRPCRLCTDVHLMGMQVHQVNQRPPRFLLLLQRTNANALFLLHPLVELFKWALPLHQAQVCPNTGEAMGVTPSMAVQTKVVRASTPSLCPR